MSTIPLNQNAIDAITELRKEYYFGEDAPLICDEHGDYTKHVNFRKRYYRILNDAGIETKGLHSLRHTFAINLVNGMSHLQGVSIFDTHKQRKQFLFLGELWRELKQKIYSENIKIHKEE